MRLNDRACTCVAMACVLAVCLCGCRKDLCYNHFREVEVELDWEFAWERDYGKGWMRVWDESLYGKTYDLLCPGVPEGVTMLVYGGEEPNERFLRTQGENIIVSGEEKSLLFYNNDTEYIVFDDIASLPQARATTTSRSRATLREMHPEERTINPPDVLYGAFRDNLPEVQLHEHVKLPVTMQPLVYTYVVRYEFEYGLKHVALVRGAMAGMAEAVYLRDGVTSEGSATLLYDCEITSYGARAEVRSFGIPGFPDEYYGRSAHKREGRRYTLNLEVMLTNGKLKDFTFDITDQMKDQPRGGVIVVSGIRIEDGENMSDSGFNVSVGDWGEFEDIDLPLVGL